MSYHNAVRVAVMKNLLELSDVQPYVINSAQVVFLNERPTKNKSSLSSSGSVKSRTHSTLFSPSPLKLSRRHHDSHQFGVGSAGSLRKMLKDRAPLFGENDCGKGVVEYKEAANVQQLQQNYGASAADSGIFNRDPVCALCLEDKEKATDGDDSGEGKVEGCLVVENEGHSGGLAVLWIDHEQEYRKFIRNFQFENQWWMEHDVKEVVLRGWNENGDGGLVKRLEGCARELLGWSRSLRVSFRQDITQLKHNMELARQGDDLEAAET
ncbi:hypothetical protein LINGRAHAP2_LOCUS32489 [Linum grandiflorum]